MIHEEERTQDIYEHLPGYANALMVPLPDPDDLSSLYVEGLNPGRFSEGLVRLAIRLTGFKSFIHQSPEKIEELLRKTNLRLPGVFSPVVSATGALRDDPRPLSPIQRAATLVLAARSLYQDLISGDLPPDEYKGQVLDMDQYPNLFSTCMIFDGKGFRVFKSKNISYIIVAIYRRFYQVKLETSDVDLNFNTLVATLEELVQFAQNRRLPADEPAPGILTYAQNETQRKAFQILQRIPVNRESLTLMRHSFLTLCLDLDSKPETDEAAAFLGHSSNPRNRWWHSSLQFVIFGNAKACAIFNFTCNLDGNTMMRGAAEIQKRAAQQALEVQADRKTTIIPPPVELKWKVPWPIARRAQMDCWPETDNQPATFTIAGVGETTFQQLSLPPIPTFIIALQMTARRLLHRHARITQFLTMSRYRCLTLTSAMVSSPEVIACAEYLEKQEAQSTKARQLLEEAVQSQTDIARAERKTIRLPYLLNIYFRNQTGIRKLWTRAIYRSTMAILKLFGLYREIQREILVSHPEIYPEVTVIGRPGVRLPYVLFFGLHYQIFQDKIVITMMPAITWRVPNAELISELGICLKRILKLYQS